MQKTYLENYQSILANIEKYVTLTATEVQQFCAIVTTTKLKKRSLILQPNTACLHQTYVVKVLYDLILSHLQEWSTRFP